MILIALIPAIALLIGVVVAVPESPRWLGISLERNLQNIPGIINFKVKVTDVKFFCICFPFIVFHGRHEEAIVILKSIRCDKKQAQIEFEEMKKISDESHKSSKNGFLLLQEALIQRWMRKCLLVGIGIGICQQIAGVNSVNSFLYSLILKLCTIIFKKLKI